MPELIEILKQVFLVVGLLSATVIVLVFSAVAVMLLADIWSDFRRQRSWRK